MDETLVRARHGFKCFMIASNESSTDYFNTSARCCNILSRHFVKLSFLCTSITTTRKQTEMEGADVSAAAVGAGPAGLERTSATVSVCVGVCVCVCVSPFDVICVSCVVSLQLLVHIKQDNHRGDEVHRLPGGQQVKVGATVATTVAIAGISPGSRNNTRASEDSSRGLGQLKACTNAVFLQKFSPRLLRARASLSSDLISSLSQYVFLPLRLSATLNNTLHSSTN